MEERAQQMAAEERVLPPPSPAPPHVERHPRRAITWPQRQRLIQWAALPSLQAPHVDNPSSPCRPSATAASGCPLMLLLLLQSRRRHSIRYLCPRGGLSHVRQQEGRGASLATSLHGHFGCHLCGNPA